MTKSCGRALDLPLPDLWYVSSKTTTFFDVVLIKVPEAFEDALDILGMDRVAMDRFFFERLLADRSLLLDGQLLVDMIGMESFLSLEISPLLR